MRRKDGRKIVVLENSRAVTGDEGEVLYYEGTLTDITEAHERSRQLSFEASHDALTGLLNRREFENRLQHWLGCHRCLKLSSIGWLRRCPSLTQR